MQGVLSVLMSDSGPKVLSKEIKEFAGTFGLTLVTSPHYAQNNSVGMET